ncbi:MAG: GerAB/ArcD/ProY family transporter [Clostridia bacterium]|nr:GerAB/ArcD/ProY family transporter [Clostridia bacterium]
MPDFLPAPDTKTPKNNEILARQIAFFAAFILPVYKLLETPSILAEYAKGDLLLPAFLQFLAQVGVIFTLLTAASRSEKTLFERINETLGKWSIVFYLLYAAYFLFAAMLPLLDLEKFVYAAFYDTAPTIFSFAAFFFLAAYISAKGIKSVGRSADLSLFLFVLPFLALIAMSLIEADFQTLLPFFEQNFSATLTAMTRTTPHFADTALLLPLIGNLRYQKGDRKKIIGGYALGAGFTLLFLAVFYGIFSTIALREHYAFVKIAQYFPVLAVVGRIDLLLIYMICIVLFLFTSFPLQFATDFTSRVFGERKKTWIAALISFAAFLFTLFCNKYYNAFYTVFGKYLTPVFIVFCNVIPSLALFLPKQNKKTKKKEHV